MHDSVGAGVGSGVGCDVGTGVGRSDSSFDGMGEGFSESDGAGVPDGEGMGAESFDGREDGRGGCICRRQGLLLVTQGWGRCQVRSFRCVAYFAEQKGAAQMTFF